MNKKLVAKTQQLNPPLVPSSEVFAKCVIIEPESSEIAARKGTIYGIYSINSEISYDTKLVDTVIKDVIHNSYYQSENISPVQSLEKAITEAREKLALMSNDTLSFKENGKTFKLDFIAAVLWGNVLYIVVHGDSEAHLMREGTVRPVSTVAEGNFSSASGVLRDDDVIIMCTKSFGETCPPQKLLTAAVSEQELNPTEACVLMKVSVDLTFSKDEIVEFEDKQPLAEIKSKKIVKEVVERVRVGAAAVATKLVSTIKGIKFKPGQFSLAAATPKPQINRLSKFSSLNKAELKKFIIPAISLILVISVGATLWKRSASKPKPATDQTQATQTQNPQTEPTEQKPPEPPKPTYTPEEDAKNKVIRVPFEGFYDIKIADSAAEPTEVVALKSDVVVTDTSTGKIYISKTDTAKFAPLTQTFLGIRDVMNFDESLAFADNEGYKFFNPISQRITESYKKSDLGKAWAYADFVYELKDGSIFKYTKKDSTLESSTWATTEELKTVKSFVTAYNIFMIKADNTVVAYLTGKKTDFGLKNLDKPLGNAVKLVTTTSFDNIYILDKAEKRVVVVNKETGVFVKQFKCADESSWTDLKSLDVSQDEKTIWVLNGSTVIKFSNSSLSSSSPAPVSD